jgi:16S rRNA (guanine527-N7)-methyltransferase
MGPGDAAWCFTGNIVGGGDGGGAGESRSPLASLAPEQQRQIELLLSQLELDEHAPTRIRDVAHAMDGHVADSLAALELDAVAHAGTLADLGSGSGFPGLALAVALPAAEVCLVESQRRKCEFLQRLCAAAGVHNARVVCARVEQWRDGIERNDVVLARALAAQSVVLEYAAPLLRVDGTLVDWRGRRDAADEAAAQKAGELLGMARVDVLKVTPFEGATDRHLHVFVKAEATPERFPRRPGIARKRPLGS